jgi:hypothetical protein
VREIQGLQGLGAGGAIRAGKNIIVPGDNLLDEDESAYDPTSPLSKELQLYPWPADYKPRILVFDGRTNPRKFHVSYETAITSAGGDAQILAKSLIMAVEDIAHDWYTSLKPLSIKSWGQVRAELVSTFQGYHPGMKTTRDLLNCIQRDAESLSEFLERFIHTKAQVPNAPKETVIVAVVQGLATGQCAAHFARNYPTSVRELFKVMGQYARSDDDLKKRKAARNSWRQAGKAPRPPPTLS